MKLPQALTTNEETPPQVLGEFKPVDDWQAHLNAVFYGLRGTRARDYYQTLAGADYRLAHALAADFHQAHRVRTDLPATLVVQEWGCGNGNLAACFLSHLRDLDAEGSLYRKTRYVLVDKHRDMLQAALAHPDLQPHRAQVSSLQADVEDLAGLQPGTVHWIHGNELWSDLRTKIVLRKEGEVIEERLRPNLSDAKSREFADWFAFVKAFEARDVANLNGQPPFLDEIIWEKDYGSIDWKRVPYRKMITEFLKSIDDLVIVPVNLGAFATIKEAQRLLAPRGRVTFLDAGTPDQAVLANPDKPCYGLHGGQYSFIVNFALCEDVARHLGFTDITIESQQEFVSRMLGVNVMTVVDLLETYPSLEKLQPWEGDQLVLKTLQALDRVYTAPYRRPFDYPIRAETPEPDRTELATILERRPRTGVPDPIAYLSEEEVLGAMTELEALGFQRDRIQALLRSPAGQGRPIEYYRFSLGQEKSS